MVAPSVTRQPTASGWIEFARAPVPPALTGLVAGRCGNAELAAYDVVRTMPASTVVPVVIAWGDPQEVVEASGGTGTGHHLSLLAGLRPGPTRTRFRGAQACVQVYLTPLGARRLLGVTGREVAGQVLPLDDVAPRLAVLSDRLAETATWAERLGLVDQALLALAGSAREDDALAQEVWSILRSSHGTAPIGGLPRRTGFSARTVASRFTTAVGLSPKTASRILRFEHASRVMGRGTGLADVAADSGYADQSHLSREFTALAGITPGTWTAAAPPSPRGALTPT